MPATSSRSQSRKRKAVTSQSGYTLIEILVVVTLSIMLTIAASGLFLATLVGNSRKEELSSVKDEGNYALSQMEFMIRNAVALVANPSSPTNPICTTGMSSITVKSIDEGITTFYVDNTGKIASSSANHSLYYLNSNSVALNPTLTFDCYRGINENTYVHINFGMQRASSSAFYEPTPTSELFDDSVAMRNY